MAGWAIDKPLRFQLAYIPDGKVQADAKQAVPSLRLSQDFMPDIDNIVLANIKELGFFLPDRQKPERFKLYLKLFDLPPEISAKKLCLEILDAYHISDMPGGAEIVRFTSLNDNVAVKFGCIDSKDKVFSPTSPFPSFTVSQDAAFASAFAKNTLFYSLYVIPDMLVEAATDDELAHDSAQGVIAFHQELLAHYNKTLNQVSGAEPDKYFYYRDEKNRVSIKVIRKPFVFDNWRQLPMPTDPQRHFLSGLVLIFRSQDSDTPLASEAVFEVASVVRLKQSVLDR